MDDTPEMILIPEEDYNELLSDVEYWNMTTMMLSALLSENAIEHEVSEEALARYLPSVIGVTS